MLIEYFMRHIPRMAWNEIKCSPLTPPPSLHTHIHTPPHSTPLHTPLHPTPHHPTLTLVRKTRDQNCTFGNISFYFVRLSWVIEPDWGCVSVLRILFEIFATKLENIEYFSLYNIFFSSTSHYQRDFRRVTLLCLGKLPRLRAVDHLNWKSKSH